VILRGDCIEVMAELPEASVDAIVTDPPYGLGFMGKRWDALPPGEDVAREALRVLKPGGHLLAFGGTRTYHRLACAVEDAGFEIRDTICWLYGSGFPKSLDVSKAIDKAAGAEREVVGEKVAPNGKTHAELHGARSGRAGGGIMGDAVPVARNSELVTAPATAEAAEWDGWGTALKPAHEPVVVARKPLVGTVAANVAEHGTGALNIDGCRIEADWSERSEAWKRSGRSAKPDADKIAAPPGIGIDTSKGRWPANVVLDEEAAGMLDEQTGDRPSGSGAKSRRTSDSWEGGPLRPLDGESTGGDSGGAARFFYVAKASRGERNAGLDGFEEREAGNFEDDAYEWATDGKGNPRSAPVSKRNHHPTVKPIALMRWLVRLVTPPGGTVLDPFVGSGTTGCAAALEGFEFVGIEREPEYAELAEARIAHWAERAVA
jgi:DNA modification methylase